MSVLEFFSLTLDYQIAKCGIKNISLPVGSGLVTAADLNPSGSDNLAAAKLYADRDSEYDSESDTRSTNSHGNGGTRKHAPRSELATRTKKKKENRIPINFRVGAKHSWR